MTTKPKKNIIAIVGTTGVGKSQVRFSNPNESVSAILTQFSIDLAEAVNGEVINSDSMQVYRGLEAITNKHPLAERRGIAHHVMDHVKWTEEYFIHRFTKEANQAIADIHSRGKVPIIVGGTHYYLQSMLFDNKTVAHEKKEITPEQAQILDGPVETLFSTLQQLDPVIAGKFHPQDGRKLRRALEIIYTTGQNPSEIYRDQKLDEFEESSLRYNTLFFWVYCNPDVLKPRLDNRVDAMMKGSALEEIKELYSVYSTLTERPTCTSGVWQVIGFKEFLPWLEESEPLLFEKGVELMKIRTRQYAKYQVKWIRKLLGTELKKEARFGYKYGGQMYMLDATDLDQWKCSVRERGTDIAEQFLSNGPLAVSAATIPALLKLVFPENDDYVSNKTLESSANWKHYECPVCKDKAGKPLVSVGPQQWEAHSQSRRHKRQIGAELRKKKHEELRRKHQTRGRSENENEMH